MTDGKTEAGRLQQIAAVRGAHQAQGTRTNPDFADREAVPPTTVAGHEPSGPLVLGLVRHGRTVEVPTGDKFAKGTNAMGELVFASKVRRVGPGQTVELEQGEIDRLVELGF